MHLRVLEKAQEDRMDVEEEEEEKGDDGAGCPGRQGGRGRGGGGRGQQTVREGAERGKAKVGSRQQQQPAQRWEDPEVFVIDDSSSSSSGSSAGRGGQEEEVGGAQGASDSEGGARGMEAAWEEPSPAPHMGVLRPPADSPAQCPRDGSLGDDPWVDLGFGRGPGVLGGSGGWEPHPQVPGLWQPAAAAAAAEGAGPGVDTQATPPPVAGRRGLEAGRSGPIIYGTPSTCDTSSTGSRLYGRGTDTVGAVAGEGGEAGSSGAEEEAEAGSAGGGVTAGLQALCCDTRTTSPPPGELEAVGRGGLASGARRGQSGVVMPGLGPGEEQQELAGGVGKDMAIDSPGIGVTTGAAASAGMGARRAGGEAGIGGVDRRGGRPAALPPRAPTPSEVVDLCSPLPLSVRLGARRGATADCSAGAPGGSAPGATGDTSAGCGRTGEEQGGRHGNVQGQGHGHHKRHRSPRPQAPPEGDNAHKGHVGLRGGERGLTGCGARVDGGGGIGEGGAGAGGGVDVGWSVSPLPLRRRQEREGEEEGWGVVGGGAASGRGGGGAAGGAVQGQEGDGSDDSDVIVID